MDFQKRFACPPLANFIILGFIDFAPLFKGGGGGEGPTSKITPLALPCFGYVKDLILTLVLDQLTNRLRYQLEHCN